MSGRDGKPRTGDPGSPGSKQEVCESRGTSVQSPPEVDSYQGLDLLPQHARMLAESRISAEVAAARGYRSVTKKCRPASLGFSRYQQRVPALLVPIWDAAGILSTHQARPDTPRTNRGKEIKYETPAKSHMVIDVHPAIRKDIGNPKLPLFITEGIKKADAAITLGLCCIALLGVWNWRGTNDAGGKTALPDWEAIALNGRVVYVVFDSDLSVKPEVHNALVRLSAFLGSRGASVAVIYLPAGQGGCKVGLDDYFASANPQTIYSYLHPPRSTSRMPWPLSQ